MSPEQHNANQAVNAANSDAAKSADRMARVIGAFEEGKATEEELRFAVDEHGAAVVARSIAKRARFLAHQKPVTVRADRSDS